MKVMVFKFKVSTWDQKGVDSEDDIEYRLNNYIYDEDLISMNINTVVTHRHNNAKDDTVLLVYTLLFKGGKEWN